MRVIAGIAGGIQLNVPKSGVRPTMDRVKGAIFSSLGDKVIGARVLDLFAGSGALGIEALSRGAASASFIEKDGTAIEVIERNLTKTKLRGHVRRADVFGLLENVSGGEQFDIIFADPPYEKTASGERYTELLLGSKALAQKLDPSGVFVLEKMPAEELTPLDLWNVVRAKKYGATEVLFLNRNHASGDDAQ
jgi:16S rRNA (guanine966-N2)-methyltransferase